MNKMLLLFSAAFLTMALAAQTPVGNPSDVLGSMKTQQLQRPENCLPCHQRQFDELRSSVKAGYRNVSPIFNGLEFSSNLLNGGLLRPVYSDSTNKTKTDGTPLTTNMTTTPVFTDLNQVRSAFCLTCHNQPFIALGDKQPQYREVPELPGVGANFKPEIFRPLRDYHMVNADGTQYIPPVPGGQPPAGAGIKPSLAASGITCETCHNAVGPDMNRSLHNDGFANTSLLINPTIDKVGPFLFPVGVKGDFHTVSRDQSRIDYLRSGLFCNGCHDVRVPLASGGSLTAAEGSTQPGDSNVTFYRLENLSTEWARFGYNSTNNPFKKVIRCQDCHMSGFPYTGTSTYTVGDQTITSPTPGIFPQDYAAVPGVSAEFDYPLPKRDVVTHYMTGVDTPMLSWDELKARLGSNYPDPYEIKTDSHGYPTGVNQRRQDLMKAAVRISTDKTDKVATLGSTFNVRVTATALTGHRFPAGFSQERTTYIQLSVKDANGVLLYQSGYVVDKPHPDTGEMAPDGNLDDEDLEHVTAVVDPGRHNATYAPGVGPALNGATNQVFASGPDNGPDSRVYAGIPEGLVLFRNELTRVYMPGSAVGRNDANGNPITVASGAHFEEIFPAAFANSVDNFRSLVPLLPTTFRYAIQLPTVDELKELGITVKGPLQVSAQVNFEHFPPLFFRYLARATGPNGPAGHDVGLVSEGLIDKYLANIKPIATSSMTVPVQVP